MVRKKQKWSRRLVGFLLFFPTQNPMISRTRQGHKLLTSCCLCAVLDRPLNCARSGLRATRDSSHASWSKEMTSGGCMPHHESTLHVHLQFLNDWLDRCTSSRHIGAQIFQWCWLVTSSRGHGKGSLASWYQLTCPWLEEGHALVGGLWVVCGEWMSNWTLEIRHADDGGLG